VKDGKMGQPLKGVRVSDNMLRMLGAVQAALRERCWIRWWEVSIRTLTPSVWVKGVGVTRSTQ
jgi:predicted Zn-dependent protease